MTLPAATPPSSGSPRRRARATPPALEAELDRLRGAFAESQAELHALQRRLAHAERTAALGALVARLAHELGTPLHSIAGHVALMLDDSELSPAVRRRAGIVAGEVERLSNLIRRYLRKLASPEPVPVLTDLNALLEGVLELFEPVLRVRGVGLELDLRPEAAAPFPCDRDQVQQVVLNLVQNAIDAMPEGGMLLLCTEGTPDGRTVSIADTGAGIPRDLRERVFESFFTTKGEGGGTGIGLGLSREIARSHGGDLVLDSNGEQGTVVTLTLKPLDVSDRVR
jgi:signal transduction histidine kinase